MGEGERTIEGFVVMAPGGRVVSPLIENETRALMAALMDGEPGCVVVAATLTVHTRLS